MVDKKCIEKVFACKITLKHPVRWYGRTEFIFPLGSLYWPHHLGKKKCQEIDGYILGTHVEREGGGERRRRTTTSSRMMFSHLGEEK